VGESKVGDLMLAQFSWSDPKDIEATLSGAGFSAIAVQKHSQDMTFEGGVDQAIALPSATPLAPQFAALPDAKKQAYAAAARKRLGKLTKGKAVQAPMVAFIVTAKA